MKKLFLLILLVITYNVTAQVVWEDANHNIYYFLESLGSKGVIEHNFFKKPLSRNEIASELLSLDSNKSKLTKLEIEELAFYKNEFYEELTKFDRDKKAAIYLCSFGEANRFRVFSYKDSFFQIIGEPMLELSYSRIKDSFVRYRKNGLSLYGYVGSNIGFNLSFLDNQDYGDYIDKYNFLNSKRGHNQTITSVIENQYDEVRANITYNWSWGNITLGKDYFKWGSGEYSQLILSDKAPSFPYIQLELQLASWFKFGYLHGWLHSGLVDSSTIHYNSVPGRLNYTQREKYIVAHYISLDITKSLNFTLGESAIYSDKLQYIYLIPVMFFRGADHYMMKDSSNSGINCQVWANSYYILPKFKTRFYGSLFIDELSLTDLLKGGNLSAIGYTLGGILYDPIIDNSSFTLEYSKIAPFVYMNSNDAQHYTSYGYGLGHYMGSNANQIFLKYTQRIIRGLNTSLSFEYTTKGQTEKPIEQYQTPYPKTLYGPQRISKILTLMAEYEILHTLFIKGSFSHSSISDQEAGRTISWIIGTNDIFSLGFSYGI